MAVFSYQAEPSACSTFIIGFQSTFWTQSRHYSPIFTMKLRVLKFFPTCTRLVFCWPHFILGHMGPAFLGPIKAIISSSIHTYFYLEDKNRKLFNKHFNTAGRQLALCNIFCFCLGSLPLNPSNCTAKSHHLTNNFNAFNYDTWFSSQTSARNSL